MWASPSVLDPGALYWLVMEVLMTLMTLMTTSLFQTWSPMALRRFCSSINGGQTDSNWQSHRPRVTLSPLRKFFWCARATIPGKGPHGRLGLGYLVPWSCPWFLQSEQVIVPQLSCLHEEADALFSASMLIMTTRNHAYSAMPSPRSFHGPGMSMAVISLVPAWESIQPYRVR